MRGAFLDQGGLFSYIAPAGHVFYARTSGFKPAPGASDRCKAAQTRSAGSCPDEATVSTPAVARALHPRIAGHRSRARSR
jgi:hypothetical protein